VLRAWVKPWAVLGILIVVEETKVPARFSNAGPPPTDALLGIDETSSNWHEELANGA